MPEFFVFALPRSRTAWMSHFLAYKARRVGHDIAAEVGSISEFTARLSVLDGSIETAAVIGWKLLRHQYPDARFAVVWRELSEVEKSLERFGVTGVRQELEMRQHLLSMAAQAPGTLFLNYHELETPEGCRELFEHCLSIRFDASWAEELNRVNIQVNVPDQLAKVASRQRELKAFREEVLIASSQLGTSRCLGLN